MKNIIIRLLAIFSLGMVVGGVLVTVHLGGQLDEITHKNQFLSQQLGLCEDELDQLKKSMGEREKKVVSSIELHITILDEDMARLEKKSAILAIEKQIRCWMEPIKGEEVEKLNYLLIQKVIDQRTIEFEGADYRLEVRLLVVGANIIIYADAIKEKEKLIQPVNKPADQTISDD
ncbi:MAG: hypothetical protein HQP61_04800 [Peptococcaceae bacterium]|nr:hypothetical protein [Candidatus Syntrophopropionicum ammoniitolerans]